MGERLSAEVFELVGVSFLREHRDRLEKSGVPIFLVTAKEPGGYLAEPADLGRLEALADRRPGAEFALARQWAQAGDTLPEAPPVPEGGDAFAVRWNQLLQVPPEERVAELRAARQTLTEGIRSRADPGVRAEYASQLTETAFLVNRACIGLQAGAPGARDQELVAETVAVIHSVVALIEEVPAAVALFRNLQSQSRSQTLDHIVRVFALMTGFLLHYNRLHGSGLVPRLRAAFGGQYRPAYARLFPGLPDSWLTSDNLVRLPALTPARIRVQALGALMHDIGKIQDLEYFENGEGYDREKIQRHPVLGSGLFLRTYGSAYEEARYIIGDHHNYLFHPDGYGLTRWERQRSGLPHPSPRCCLADSLETWSSGLALGFLPVEICSVIDVYDALTDPSRLYKQPLEPAEALRFMESKFVAARKADPILVDLFTDYLRTLGTDLPPDLGFAGKTGR